MIIATNVFISEMKGILHFIVVYKNISQYLFIFSWSIYLFRSCLIKITRSMYIFVVNPHYVKENKIDYILTKLFHVLMMIMSLLNSVA